MQEMLTFSVFAQLCSNATAAVKKQSGRGHTLESRVAPPYCVTKACILEIIAACITCTHYIHTMVIHAKYGLQQLQVGPKFVHQTRCAQSSIKCAKLFGREAQTHADWGRVIYFSNLRATLLGSAA